ncbi:helix-turn-helix domain-containing protein [Actinocorallia sp. A-T 12471]|uniref:TetR/AcrR family transcriptional regulator n=1 Tax=Actinocorallia sp. A-T 12471 TaxID=3089813 RepID=UPI0029D21B81|nr:helix-turn-helix domain-containing protein [Actinocorallia sp. A-T 12471]MDX6741119.1 helix-turn-helix domain-containing protein [Actinocorallia sp. A-T 12471]
MGSEGHGGQVDDALLGAARRLFAALGYDGTTVEMIADASGRDIAAVKRAGGKRGLYETVMEGLRQSYLSFYEDLYREIPGDARGMHDRLDRVIDIHLEYPELASLWQHRSLSDALDLSDLEKRFRQPAREHLREVFGLEPLDDSEYEMVASVFEWCVYGFVTGGVLRTDGPGRPDDPKQRTQFRDYMHHLLDLITKDREERQKAGTGSL